MAPSCLNEWAVKDAGLFVLSTVSSSSLVCDVLQSFSREFTFNTNKVVFKGTDCVSFLSIAEVR